MKALREHLNDYLALRRGLGFGLVRCGKALAHFVTFMEHRNAHFIQTSLALEWAQQPVSAKPVTWAAHLSYVRTFARYVSPFDARTEIPPEYLLPHQPRRVRPYMYTDDEVQRLMAAAFCLPIDRNHVESSVFKQETYYFLIGLLAVTGLRISEAINLKVKNVDLRTALLTIEGAKLGKSRLVPLHASTVEALRRYDTIRGAHFPRQPNDFFFVNRVGKRLDQGSIRRTFYAMSQVAGLRECTVTQPNKGPRIHDFRHRFALQTLLNWYQRGEDAERKLPVLSTFLGHVHVSDTYWYLTAYPQLMTSAIERFEQRWEAES